MAKIGYVLAYTKGQNNYGTSLQGYALLRKLRELGHDVEIIHYIKQLSFLEKVRWVINSYKCGLGVNPLKRLISANYPQQYVNDIRIRTKAVDNYKQGKLISSFVDYRGYKQLHEGAKNYDVVVVGSDQVWTPLGLPTKFYNLLFVPDAVRKVAYASSFGVNTIPSFQRKATGRYLDRFYRIGVREQNGKVIVDTLSHKTATVVADPTLLLNDKEWEEEIKESSVKVSEPYIFCYFLGNNPKSRDAANELKAKTGLKIVTFRHMDEYVPSDENFGDEAPFDVDPNDFVKYISKASYVCTDSFHCTAFSIQFHRQFMTFYRFGECCVTSRNSRIDSLFNVLGINRERIYKDNISLIYNPIDWDIVDSKLNALRMESILFLQDALK